MLNELRRPIRIDDWNQMIVEFNRLERRVIELEEKTREPEPERIIEELVFNRELESPNDFFREDCMYTFPFQIVEDIEDTQQYQLLKNVYVFDKEIKKDIEKMLSENKIIHLIVNINEKEKSTKKVEIKKNVAKVDGEVKATKRGRKKKGWFGL